MRKALFFQEAGLKNNAAAIYFAIDLFGVFGEAYALYFGATFDYHRRAFYLEVFYYGNCIAIKEFGAIAVACHIVALFGFIAGVKLVSTIGANIK